MTADENHERPESGSTFEDVADQKKLVDVIGASAALERSTREKLAVLEAKQNRTAEDERLIEQGRSFIRQVATLKETFADAWAKASDLAAHSPEFKKKFEGEDNS